VQKHTQAIKSVKDQGNTLTRSRVSNINFDMQQSTMLWDIPYSTNSNVIPGIYVFMYF
jgi:hypothetical protein